MGQSERPGGGGCHAYGNTYKKTKKKKKRNIQPTYGADCSLEIKQLLYFIYIYDLGDFECGMDVSSRWVGLSILESAGLRIFSHNSLYSLHKMVHKAKITSSELKLCRQKLKADERYHRRMARC